MHGKNARRSKKRRRRRIGGHALGAKCFSQSYEPATYLRLMKPAKETANVTITDAEGRIVLTDQLAAGATELPP